MTKTTNIQQDTDAPKGYKKTPLGVIPKDWVVKKLGDISTQLGNFSFSRAQLTDKTQRLRYIHYGDIHVMSERDNVDLRKDELPFLLDGLIDKTKIENQNFPLLQDGDVIFADASEDYEGIGNCWEVLNTNGHKIVSGLHTIPIRCEKEYVTVGFGRYIFKNRKSSTALRVIAHGTKVYSLSFKNMAKLKLALPPLPEQQKIAEILSIWDMAIEKQNALIEQLELRKRGLMQQLLTGKLRLRNAEGVKFKEEWKKVRLGEVFKLLKGAGLSKDKLEAQGRYPCILYGELYTSYNEIIKEVNSYTNYEEGTKSKKGDILIPSSTTTNGIDLITSSCITMDDVLIGGDVIILRPKKDVNSEFFSLLFSNALKAKFVKFTQGVTIIHIYGKDIINEKVTLPSFAEQTAIAEVLSTADREIEIEKQKLVALQNQKKGLMQVLLSGRVRVKILN